MQMNNLAARADAAAENEPHSHSAMFRAKLAHKQTMQAEEADAPS